MADTPDFADASRLTTNRPGTDDIYQFNDQGDSHPQRLYPNFAVGTGRSGRHRLDVSPLRQREPQRDAPGWCSNADVQDIEELWANLVNWLVPAQVRMCLWPWLVLTTLAEHPILEEIEIPEPSPKRFRGLATPAGPGFVAVG